MARVCCTEARDCCSDDCAAATLASPRCNCESSERGSISRRNWPALTRCPSSTATRVTRPVVFADTLIWRFG